MATPTTLPATFVAGNVLTAAQMNDLRGAFRILQVVSTTKTDTFTTTSTSYTDLTGLSVSITPTATSSKVFVIANLNSSQTLDRIVQTQLVRGSTAIALGDAASNRTVGSSFTANGVSDAGGVNFGMPQIITYLDSPNTTSATTYKIQIRINAAGTLYVNRTSTDTDSALFPRVISSITAFEVSA
jgi:hypothetical protein